MMLHALNGSASTTHLDAPDDALLAATSLSLTPPKAKAPVLKDASFTIRRGRATAVLGPSGSGKTVLLQLIAGRLDVNSFGPDGEIHGALTAAGATTQDSHAPEAMPHQVAGEAATLREKLYAVEKRTSYVPPDDVVFGFDTPREAIVFRHRLAFGSTAEEAGAAAATLIDELGLTACADNLIAPGVGLRGISGGQRRRTCIAMALATRPDLLVLDEPTTGLDSTTAKHVMAAVQGIARRYGCAVVQSLQQPGSDLFPYFDDLILLKADGSLEYAGPTLDGPAWVPKNHERFGITKQAAGGGAGGITTATTAITTTTTDTVEHATPGSAPFLGVASLVIARHFRALVRNPLALIMRAVQSLILGLFFGFVFFDLELTSDNFKQVLGFLLVIICGSLAPMQTGTAVFPLEKEVYLEEQKLFFKYSGALYAFSKFVTEACAMVPLTAMYAAIMAGLAGLPAETVGTLTVSVLLLTSAGEGLGFAVSTVASPAIAIGVIVPTIGFAMVLVGTGLATGTGATEELFDVLKSLAYIRNGYAAAAIDVLELVDTPCSAPGRCFFDTKEQALAYYDLDSTSLGQEWGLLVMWLALFRVFSAVSLIVLGYDQKVRFDARKHRRAPVVSGDATVHVQHGIRGGVRYAATPRAVELRWDVTFSVKPRFGGGASRTILHGLQGRAASGRTLAIMGGSGAGKSTLLEALSIRLPATNVFTATERLCTIDVLEVETAVETAEGSVGSGSHQRVTGATVHADVGAAARSLIGFVHQDPQFVHGLTPREVIAFAAAVSLREADPAARDMEGLTQDLLDQLGLTHVAGVPCELLSGSQRKRAACGVAIAQHRPILMLDEPTSGLDPESALELLTLLQELARTHMLTVMYTLHQPGDELLPHIDDLLLLSRGHVMYHGALEEADTALEKEHARPAGLNATDHYLELSADEAASEGLIASWAERSRAVADATGRAAGVPETTAAAAATTATLTHHAGAGAGGRGFAALVRRSFTATVLRTPKATQVGKFVTLYMFLPLILGVSFFDQADSIVAVQNVAFTYVMGLGFSSGLLPLMDLHLEREVFLREQESDQYSPVLYYLARSAAGLPLEIAGVTVYAVIAYFMAGFRADAGAFFVFLAVSFIQQQTCVGLGYTVGVAVPSIVVSAALTTLVMVGFATGCGVLIGPQSISDTYWLHAVEFTSPTRQAQLILMWNEVRDRAGAAAQIEGLLGFDRRFDEEDICWVLLVVLCVMWRVQAGLCFRLMTRAGGYDQDKARKAKAAVEMKTQRVADADEA